MAIVITLTLGLNEKERKQYVQTVQLAPISWQFEEARSGNFGWLILGPAGLPYVFGSDEYCLAEVGIEGETLVVQTARDLCETRPSLLEITYKTWEYNSNIQIMKVGVPEES